MSAAAGSGDTSHTAAGTEASAPTPGPWPAAVRVLTRCGVRVPGGLVEPEVVRFGSADGVTVRALLYRPHRATSGTPVPVVMSVHGGPETQELPVWGYTNARYQYLLSRGPVY